MSQPEKVRNYSNDEITVSWNPSACIHSTKCWKGMIRVFNPRERPWINLSGASTAEIISQVEQCPSGAISWKKNESTGSETNDVSATSVEVMANGPLLVHGSISVKDLSGNEVKKGRVTAFCRCGASGNKPYCDGSHSKIDFKG